MIEQKQLYLHKPAEGSIGDCWRTSIACILDVSPGTIPHYYEEFWEPEPAIISVKVRKATNLFLRDHFDLTYIEYPIEVPDAESLNTYLEHYYRDTHIMLGCSSKNGGHSVVRKGYYMWDPAIDNSGCVGPMNDGYYWIGLLVKA